MTTKRQGPGFLLLAHCGHLLDECQRELLTPLGIHAGQARVLHALNRMGQASQRSLAKEFHISAASMSQMTKRLIGNGLVETQDNPKDGRASLLSLTPEGEVLLAKVFDVWAEVDQIVIDAIGEDNATQLFANAHGLRDALGGRAPGSKEKRL